MAKMNFLEQVEEALCQLGFNRSQVRLYLALLKQFPATGYELAARSGVPRAAIYHTLQELEKEGLVSKVQESPARYQPLEPERLLQMLKLRFQKHFTELEEGLKNIARPAAPAGTWNVIGYDQLIEQARVLIAGCRRSVHLSLWRREADQLADTLRQAQAEGREVVLFSFNPLPADCGRSFTYDIPEQKLEKHWPHKIILIADLEQALMGGAEKSTENRAVLTREPALVEMAISNLVLDLTLWGQRHGQDTSAVISGMTRFLAPIEDLAKK